MAVIQTCPAEEGRRRVGFGVWLWSLAAAVSAGVLVVAIVGRDRGDGPTLRPMEASDSMSEQQAHAVADNTVRLWVRERNDRHLANLEALSCPDSRGTVSREINEIKLRHPPGELMHVFATGGFARRGSVWTLNTHFDGGRGTVFVMRVIEDELRVCAMGSAPVP